MSQFPMRIIDAHHHLWDLSAMRYPWLQDGPPVDQDRSGLAPIRRDYLSRHFRADIGNLPVVGSVHVEAAHDPDNPIAETRWIDGLAESSGMLQALVAFARLDDPELAHLLDEHASSARLRGVRQMVNWEHDAPIAERPKLLEDPAWLAGLDILARRGLSFDLQVFPSQLEIAAEVVRSHPDLLFILDHGGYLLPASPQRDLLWRKGIEMLAASPNIVVKASSYASVDPAFDPAGLSRWLDTLRETFGPHRLLWGSNFPVDRRFIGYNSQVAAYAAAVAGWGDEDRDAFWFGNARTVYRLGDGPA